jgi:4-amino-4-deoxy-L-arabinose transferase-like glycosyltransferase
MFLRASRAGLCVLALGLAAGQWSLRSGLTPDSVTYLDPARNLAAGRGLVHYWAYWDPVYETAALPTATTLWPPGYPMLIALLVTLGMDPTVSGRLISLLSFALLPLPVYGLFRYLLPPYRAILGTLVVVGFFPLFTWATSVATEMPFTLLVSLCLLLTLRARETADWRRAAALWALAGAFAAASFLLRYVGLVCVAGVVVGAATSPRLESRARWLPAVVYSSLPGALAVVGVALRNWLVMGTLGQPVPTGTIIFWTTLPASLRALAAGVVGSKELLGTPWSLVRFLEVGLLGLLASLAAVSFARAFRTARRSHDRQPAEVRVSTFVALFFLVCLGLTLVALSRSGDKVLEGRYVVVYLPCVMVLVMGWALRGGFEEGGSGRQVATRAAVLASVLWVGCQAFLTGRSHSRATDGYVGSAGASPVVAWIKANVATGETVLSSRGADLAYWCPNPVLRLPKWPHSAKGVTDWKAVDDLARRAHARYLVHVVGYPEDAKYDRQEFAFLRSMDAPQNSPERFSVRLANAVVYGVGPTRSVTPAPVSMGYANARAPLPLPPPWASSRADFTTLR